MPVFMESPRFPDDLSVGVSFGPEFVTAVAGNPGGYEARNRTRARALCRGEASHAVRTMVQLQDLVKFFRSVGGRWAGFRFKDWSDFKLAEADCVLTLVTGTVNQYQLNKLYRAAVGFEELRPIRKPVVGTLVLKDLGATVAVGAGAGQYSIDTTTGIFTQVASQTRTVSSHTVGAAHQVVQASALSPNVSIGQKVALTGVTGTAATTLNGKLHPVTNVSGATLTLGVNTAGLTATGGTVSLYRQEADLDASCDFDVPVRFDTDSMPTRFEAYQIFSWGQIPVMEIRQP